jgi:cysteinyl-tRNA synthetase
VPHLHDTATGLLAPVEPDGSGRVGMYVCGPTVYGPPHVGHGRLGLVFDILRRYLSWRGLDVHHVSNITDIDDKIINVAVAEGRSSGEVAAENEALWWQAMDTMGLLRPEETPHATHYLPQMVEMIGDLVDKSFAYETSDGVYLAANEVDGYGLLAHQSLDSLRSGARVEVNENKRTPIDFALWKKAKPAEPEWPSPWGAGRPGWHTECVVMALALLGEGFSLHGGGEDLKFPHHENERAQAVALGRRFTRLWVHNGMLVMGGEKMSKSLGNTQDLAGLLEEHDPRSYRLVMLQAHYRAQVELGPGRMADATSTLGRVDSLARRVADAPSGQPQTRAAAELVARFTERMDDDLHTPLAMEVLFDGVRSANAMLDSVDAQGGLALGRAVLECFEAVGLVAQGSQEIPASVLALARARDDARAGRDWAAADQLRDEIVALGFRVEDGPSGTRVLR